MGICVWELLCIQCRCIHVNLCVLLVWGSSPSPAAATHHHPSQLGVSITNERWLLSDSFITHTVSGRPRTAVTAQLSNSISPFCRSLTLLLSRNVVHWNYTLLPFPFYRPILILLLLICAFSVDICPFSIGIWPVF